MVKPCRCLTTGQLIDPGAASLPFSRGDVTQPEVNAFSTATPSNRDFGSEGPVLLNPGMSPTRSCAGAAAPPVCRPRNSTGTGGSADRRSVAPARWAGSEGSRAAPPITFRWHRMEQAANGSEAVTGGTPVSCISVFRSTWCSGCRGCAERRQ